MDRVDASGTVSLRYGGHLLHLGIGRAYKYDKVRLLVHDTEVIVIHHDTAEIIAEYILDDTEVIVIHHDTAEIIAEYILDDTKNYQAKKKHPGPKTEV